MAAKAFSNGLSDKLETVRSERRVPMLLSWAITFLVIAIIAGIFGFAGIAGTLVWIAKVLFVIFIILFLFSMIWGRRTPIA